MPVAPIRPTTQFFCAAGPRKAKEMERPPANANVPPAALQCEPITWSLTTLPLVTCIMPTRDRPAYVRQSIRYFERQTYPERELIILDDGIQPLAGEIPIHPRIRCVRSAPGQSVGAKRNQGCELARGTIIAHWDDDDWYGPDRLRAQVEPLLQNVAEITALRETTFFYVERWEFWKCTPQEHQRLFVGDVHGGTLVYFRHVWEYLAHYPCVSLAEDAAFLRRALNGGARLQGIPSEGLFLYLRHAANTWSLNANMFRNSSRWQRSAEPGLPLKDRAFYEKRWRVNREICA
jgi:glycosyltransferase involved in cell wall biosynthesis